MVILDRVAYWATLSFYMHTIGFIQMSLIINIADSAL